MVVPQLRPLGVGEMLDVALKIYWRNAWTLFRLVLLVVAPVSVLTALLTVSATATLDEDFFTVDEETGELQATETDEIGPMIAGFSLAVVLAFLAGILATGACFKAVADAYLGASPSWRESLRYVLRRLHSVLWVTILGTLLTVLGVLFCLVPGIYLWAAFAVAVPVLLTEGVRGRHALGRSRDLVRGHWWRTFGVILLGTILTSIVGGALGALVGAFTFFGDPEGDSPSSIVGTILADTISQTLTVPFTAALVTVLYVDLRVRKEAFDLQLLAQQIGVEPRPEHAPLAEPRPEHDFESGEQPPIWPPPPGWQPRRPPDDET